MPNSIITNSIMGHKIEFPEFFRNGTGCYAIDCFVRIKEFHANIDDCFGFNIKYI